jgi:hypothetical protein
VSSIVSEGKTYAVLVNVFAVLGGAAVVAGSVVRLTAPSAPPPKAMPEVLRLRISPVLGPGVAAVAAQGVFP